MERNASTALYNQQWTQEDRQVDENLKSSVLVEAIKLLANSSYGYQIMDLSRHFVTK